MYRIKSILMAAAIPFMFSLPAIAQDATEIVKKADQKMRGESAQAQMTMKIIRPAWQRSMSLKTWSKGNDYALIVVTAPSAEEGTAYLKRGNEIWNWLPDINRTIKLPPSMMSQSWMGSDFSNNDLVRESSIVTDYTHTLAGDSTINGREVYKIKMEPRPEAPVVWGEVVIFISKDEYLQLRTEFYDEDGELIKVLEGSEVREIGGRVIPTRMEMIPADEPSQKTVLIYEDIEFNIDISESFFSIQNMKQAE